MKLKLDVYSFDVEDRKVLSIWIMVYGDGRAEAVHMPYIEKGWEIDSAAINTHARAQEIIRIIRLAGVEPEIDPKLESVGAIMTEMLNCPHR